MDNLHSIWDTLKSNTLTKKFKFMIFINVAINAIVLFISTFLILNYSKNMIASAFIICMLIFVITFNLYLLYKAIKDFEKEKLINKSLTILNDDVRAFKHDFSNIIQSLGGYVSLNDMQGLKNFYYQLLDDFQIENNLYALNPEIVNNPAIYSLLASKYYKANDNGIKLNLEILIDLNAIDMKIYELTRIMGILLDNAIEAAKCCGKKIINLSLTKDISHHRQLMVIENTYTDKNIDLDRIFEKAYSTKPNNTGLGLWEIRQILKKNKNLNLFTTKSDYFFKQQLEIYTNKATY